MKEIMSYGNINKNTVYDVERKLEKFIAPGGWDYLFLNVKKLTTLGLNLDELIMWDPGWSIPPPPPPRAGDEHFRTNMRG
jgi:hypothetical protein